MSIMKVFEYNTDNLVLLHALQEQEQVHIHTNYVESSVKLECNFTPDADKLKRDVFYTLELSAPVEGGLTRKTVIHKAQYDGVKTFEMFKVSNKENCLTLGLYGEVEIIP